MNPDIQCPLEPDPGVVAGILVGGQSRRMGIPKAELTHQGQRFIDLAVQAAGAVASKVVLLGHPHAMPAGLEHLAILPDPVPQAGPLAGLCSLMRHAGDRWTLLLACDMPLIDGDLLRRLLAEPRGSADVVAFRMEVSRGRVPCCMMVHPRVRRVVEVALRGEERSIQGVLNQIRCVWIDAGVDVSPKLLNINTPEEYARLQSMANAGGRSAEPNCTTPGVDPFDNSDGVVK